MIVNIRGNNGSGKTTIVRAFLEGFPKRPLYGKLGIKYPEAYHVEIRSHIKGTRPLYVLGPYHSKTGGIDAVSGRGLDTVVALIDRYCGIGHVLFEGVMISTSFGEVGAWLKGHASESIVAFLDTPLDVCVESVYNRTGDGAKSKHMADKAVSIERVRQRMIVEGLRCELISRDNGFEKIKGWLSA